MTFRFDRSIMRAKKMSWMTCGEKNRTWFARVCNRFFWRLRVIACVFTDSLSLLSIGKNTKLRHSKLIEQRLQCCFILLVGDGFVEQERVNEAIELGRLANALVDAIAATR